MTDEKHDLLVMENPDKEVLAVSDTVRASWNFSLDRIRENTGHYTQDERDCLIALFRWCIDPLHPMRRDHAARELKCSQDLIYQLLTGKYRNPDKSKKSPSPEFMDRLRKFLADEAKKYSAVGEDFVKTPTAEKVFTACKLAQESHTPVILYGPSQIGKTWPLRYFKSHNNHGKTCMSELEAACGLGGMVKTIATDLGLSAKRNTTALIESIKNGLSSDMLLILDEMHLLKHTYRVQSFFASVEVIRRIHDKRKCGMILSWTNLKDLQNAGHDELVQVWRRGVHRVALPTMPTKVDLGMIFNHHGFNGDSLSNAHGKIKDCVFPNQELEVIIPVRGADPIIEKPYAIIRQVAKENGLLAISERIRYAKKMATKHNSKVSWEYFVRAHLTIEKMAVQEGEWS